MSTPHEPAPAALIIALLRAPHIARDEVHARLVRAFGPIAIASGEYAFTLSSYYQPEMGAGLLREYLIFDHSVNPGALADIKLRTNALEQEWSSAGCRAVNLDPGLLTEHNLVLATGKDFAHRIYLRDGIYAEVTLRAHGGRLQPLPWTYPDYQLPATLEFFETHRRRVRAARRLHHTSA